MQVATADGPSLRFFDEAFSGIVKKRIGKTVPGSTRVMALRRRRGHLLRLTSPVCHLGRRTRHDTRTMPVTETFGRVSTASPHDGRPQSLVTAPEAA
jgi:hypothetical protein